MKYLLGCALALMISLGKEHTVGETLLVTLLSWFYVLVQVLVKIGVIQ